MKGIIVVMATISLLLLMVAMRSADNASARQIQHGAYLVNHVAMCVQCHTPRDNQGNLIEQKLLDGAPIPVVSPYPNNPWAFRAPKIAGLPGWQDGDTITLLMTGKRPNGVSPKPPMPPFRMTEQDAAAVVAYLRSLE